MSPLLRRCAFGVASAIAILAWYVAFAWPGAPAPWRAQHVLDLPSSQFSSQNAVLEVQASGMRVRAAEPGRLVDLHIDIAEIEARDYRYLSYAFAEVPRTRKLVVVWQGSEGRGFATLPDGFGHADVLDLARVAAWKGRIARIGLAMVPVDYVPPEALSAPDAWIGELSLSSPSMHAAVAALFSEWTATRAWTGRSNNTGGFDFVGTQGPSLLAFVAGIVVILSLLVLAFFGRRRAAGIVVPLIVAATGLLALEQVHQHVARTSSVISASRALLQTGEVSLSGHPPLAADARIVLQRLHEDGVRSRIWVHGAAGFLSDHAVWLLREQDAGGFLSPHQLPSQAAVGGSLLVLVGAGDWDFDPAASTIRIGAEVRGAERYFEGNVMKVYRFSPEAGTTP